MIVPIKAELDKLKQQLSQQIPTEHFEVFDADANRMQAEFTSPLQVQVGDQAPDFELPNATGDAVRLTDLLAKGSVVLVFYRGAWCPYCNLQLSTYREATPELSERGAQLVAISPQKPDQSLSQREKHNLSYDILSDLGNSVARQYTQVFEVANPARSSMETLGVDFKAFYADDKGEIPVPAVFVIGQSGKIIFADSQGGDYKQRTEIAEVLKALDS